MSYIESSRSDAARFDGGSRRWRQTRVRRIIITHGIGTTSPPASLARVPESARGQGGQAQVESIHARESRDGSLWR